MKDKYEVFSGNGRERIGTITGDKDGWFVKSGAHGGILFSLQPKYSDCYKTSKSAQQALLKRGYRVVPIV